MKVRIFGFFMMFFILGITMANAAPERIAINDPSKEVAKKTAASQLKNIDLRDIEDPAARNAIQGIMNYLGLKTQNNESSEITK